MKIERNKIVQFCEEYLKTKDFKDYCFNGLQVEGTPEIEKIITGVSFSKKLIESAIKKQAEMIIAHHGIFSNQIGSPPQIKGAIKKRLRLLLENDINLCGFHLPLDAHPEIGNNISLLRLFGLKKVGIINTPDYGDIGFLGEFDMPIEFKSFVEMVNKKLNTKSYVIAAGSEKVKKIGIISGGASPEFALAAELGADTYICGDVRESIVRQVEEVGINFINAWHYNTEKLGIKNLGNLISNKFNIKVEFVDIPCDI
ncbi:MAG: Nif3-like dinuclear metal center hexameric protein [Candidatus Cloacimonetes bacterium]|nr:Nif3-like dinuclear metal center hexameric protein [Candidatus Cloacimonadota bacterium]